MYNLKVTHFIDSAHRLVDSDSLVTKKCRELHGHTYKVEVGIHEKELVDGMIVDFKKIKDIIDILDHRYINDVFTENGFYETSTAENIAKFIYEKIENNQRSIVDYVAIWEGYKGENSPSVTYKLE